MPRYMREEATTTGITTARVRNSPLTSAERARSEASTAIAPYNAIAAAVCPKGKLKIKSASQMPDRRPLAVHQQGDRQEDADLAGHRHRHQHRLPPATPRPGRDRHREHGQDGDGQDAAEFGGEGG